MHSTQHISRVAYFTLLRLVSLLMIAHLLLPLLSPSIATASTPAAVLASPLAQVSQGADLGEIEVESNNTSGSATAIGGSNIKLKGSLFPSGDIDFYSFTAAAGDRVYAAIMTAFSAGNSTDSQLTVLASDGTTVIEFDDDNGVYVGLSSSIAGATLPTAGTYYLKVNDFTAGTASERPYELYLRLQSGGVPTPEVEPNDTPATANPLPTNGWVSGTRNPATAAEQDWYSLNLNAGDTVFLSLDLDPERDSVTWNGRLGFALFGDANNQILPTDDAGTGDVTPNPNIPSEAFFMTVKNAGTYFAFVDSATAAVGGPTATYHLSVSVIPHQTIGVNCTTYTSTNVPQTIGPGTGLTSSTITVPGNPRIADLNVSIVLNHAVMADIDAHLRSPAGNDNGLFTDIGAAATGGQTQMDVTFDDEAGLPPSFTALKGTTLKPELNYRLAWFKGEDAGGTWTLDLRDDTAGANGGTLTSWSLEICEQPPLPASPAGFAPITVFSTDFESGAAGFTHSGTADEWALGLPATAATSTANPVAGFTTCNSGVNCWKTDLTGTYNLSSNQDLLSPNIDLTGRSGPITLTWAQKYQIENANIDHASVEVREVGNPSNSQIVWQWLDATMTDPPGNPIVNIGASAGWGLYHADISNFAGKNIEVRFHLDSDTIVNLAGLAIDDVSVTAQRPLAADVSLTKTASPTTANPGQPITYTLTFTNAGPDPANNVILTDTVPISVTNLSVVSSGAVITNTGTSPAYVWQVQNLAPTQGGIITITGQIDSALHTGGLFNNTATISAVSDSTPGNNSATAPITIIAIPEIAVLGNSQEIANEDTTPFTGDATDFGSLALGQAIAHTFTISNSGSADLHLTGTPLVALSGPNAGDFSVVIVPVTPLSSGLSCLFQVRFTPNAVGTRIATVTIANDDSDEKSYRFSIQGIGTNSAPIANAGTDQSVGIGTLVTLNGSTSSDPDGHIPLIYGWSQTGGPAVSLSNASSASPTFTAPAASAILTFSLMVTDSFGLAALAPDSVAITVTTTPPDIAVLGNGQLIAAGDTTPAASDDTDFGSLDVGQAITHTFTISNTGGADLHLLGTPLVAISGANASDFSVVVDPTTPIGAGLSSTFQLRFTPSAGGVRAATVTISNDDGDENSYSLAIQGTGTALPPTATHQVYLPLIVKSVVAVPDLIMESISASSGGVTVVIKNIGNAPVVDAFWVDVYFNPSQRPSYNLQWEQIAPNGAVWGVTSAGLSQLTPGGALTLTANGDYYSIAESGSIPFPVGAQVYAQVDSVDPATSYGAVQESNEDNNIFGPISSTFSSQIQAATATVPPVLAGLPRR